MQVVVQAISAQVFRSYQQHQVLFSGVFGIPYMILLSLKINLLKYYYFWPFKFSKFYSLNHLHVCLNEERSNKVKK